MRVGVYVDVSDVYHKLSRKFKGAKLDYNLLLTSVKLQYGPVVRAFAYGVQREKEAVGFITCLRAEGFETRFKRPKIIRINDREIKQCNWGVGLAIDVVRMINHLDVVVIVSSDSDLVPLVRWIRDQAKQVVILASCIPKILRDAATETQEISEGLLEKQL